MNVCVYIRIMDWVRSNGLLFNIDDKDSLTYDSLSASEGCVDSKVSMYVCTYVGSISIISVCMYVYICLYSKSIYTQHTTFDCQHLYLCIHTYIHIHTYKSYIYTYIHAGISRWLLQGLASNAQYNSWR